MPVMELGIWLVREQPICPLMASGMLYQSLLVGYTQ